MLSDLTGLSDRVLDAIADLEARVIGHDGGRLKLEWAELRRRPPDECNDVAWWAADVLAGFAGLYRFGGDVEMTGMVDPRFRRSGVGSALLRRLCDIAAGRRLDQALLVVPRSTGAGAAFAVRRGGALDHSEHFLVLGATPPGPSGRQRVEVRPLTGPDVEPARRILAEAFGGPVDDVAADGEDPSNRQLVVVRAGAVVGTLRLSTDVGTTSIYGFAVDRALRGQGVGRDALVEVCRMIRRQADRVVTLEVALHNERALNLYTSVGFERRATDDYYRLATGPPG